jgi:hypothetical protein
MRVNFAPSAAVIAVIRAAISKGGERYFAFGMSNATGGFTPYVAAKLP